MEKIMKTILKILFIAVFTIKPLWALDEFQCQCKAKAPGFEATNKTTGGIDKICSYSCKCLAWDTITNPKTKVSVANHVVPNILLDIINAPTTAYSRESWDMGSHVCHGQYAYKPNWGDENWKIVVKFDTFTLSSNGEVSYPEDHSREFAMGMSQSGFKYTLKALEIAASIKDQLKKY